MNILITGSTGFLGEELTTLLFRMGHSTIRFKGRVQDNLNYDNYKGIDIVLHLAAPSVKEDYLSDENVRSSIISGTDNMIKLSNRIGAQLIYFSSEAQNEAKDLYGTCKRISQNTVKEFCNDYKILVVPRVYDKTREKGLIGRIKRDEVPSKDFNKVVEYWTLEDFKKEFIKIFESQDNGIYEFGINNKNTIKELIDLYK